MFFEIIRKKPYKDVARWSRFLSYAARVHGLHGHICLPAQGKLIQILFQYNGDSSFLPSLKTIRWGFGEDDVRFLSLLAPPTLRSLDLSYHKPCDAHGHRMPLYNLSGFPILTTLSIIWCDHHIPQDDRNRIVQAALSAPGLMSFRLAGPEQTWSGQGLTPSEIGKLGTMSTLQALNVNINSIDIQQDKVDLLRIRKLRCRGGYIGISTLITALHSPLLIEFKASLASGGIFTLHNHILCMQSISASRFSQTLRILSLRFGTPRYPSSITLRKFLQPLFSMNRLEVLSINCPQYSIVATDPDLLAVACAFPNLRALAIKNLLYLSFPTSQPTPSSHRRSASSSTMFSRTFPMLPEYPSWPFWMPPATLAVFAQHCPHLLSLKLGLVLDPSCLPPKLEQSIPGIPNGHPLRELQVGLARAGANNAKVWACALLLDAMFPNLDTARMRVLNVGSAHATGGDWGVLLDYMQGCQLERAWQRKARLSGIEI